MNEESGNISFLNSILKHLLASHVQNALSSFTWLSQRHVCSILVLTWPLLSRPSLYSVSSLCKQVLYLNHTKGFSNNFRETLYLLESMVEIEYFSFSFFFIFISIFLFFIFLQKKEEIGKIKTISLI